MPHVIVKMHPGRSEQQKAELAEAIVKDVIAVAKVGEKAVSVAIEEVKSVIGPTRSINRTRTYPSASGSTKCCSHEGQVHDKNKSRT